MSILKVADFPAEIYDRVKIEALHRNITFEQQLISLVENGLSKNSTVKERRKALFDRIKSRTIPNSAKELNSVEIVRNMRKERI